MIVDANVLLYAVHLAFGTRHERVREWLDGALSADRVALPWISLLAFVRLSTSDRVFERPMQPADAMAHVRDWLSLPNVWVPAPGADHAVELERSVRRVGAVGNDVYDAHLAALAIEHGVPVVSADMGFSRFPIRLVNPLVAN